jgi:hypothetical protein
MRRSARTDLCGGRSVMIVPTASLEVYFRVRYAGAMGSNLSLIAEGSHGVEAGGAPGWEQAGETSHG